MSEYESLRKIMDDLRSDLDSYNNTVARFVTRTAESLAAQERLVSDLADDVHENVTALSNRIESVARSAATPFDPPEAA